jgi:hypothetical protein
MVLERGSSFTTGWFVIEVTFVAYVRVEMFYSKKLSFGVMHAIIRQYELPPIDCFKIDVSLELR